MNDRLRFRIFYNNKMVYPNSWENIESIYECLKQQVMWDCAINVDFKFNHIANNLIFMQCTGLKDKNGKLIYEGDVVKDDHDALHYVKWVYDSWQLFPCTQNNYTIGIVDDEIEVIGNIYENKGAIR